jgi:hypothetical protein
LSIRGDGKPTVESTKKKGTPYTSQNPNNIGSGYFINVGMVCGCYGPVIVNGVIGFGNLSQQRSPLWRSITICHGKDEDKCNWAALISAWYFG